MSRLAAIAGVCTALCVLCALALLWHSRQVDTLTERVREEERRQAQAAADQVLAAAARRNRDLETQAAIADLENRLEQDRLKQAALAASDRARTADERLQRATSDLRRRAAAVGAHPAAGSFADEAAAAATALGECSSRYRSLGDVADQLSIQVTGLQRYLREVVLPVCSPEGQPNFDASLDGGANDGIPVVAAGKR